MEILYIDALFFLNLLTDYLLCLVSARLCGLVLKRRRYALAALFGAGYAIACVFPALGFLSAPPVLLGAGLLMGWIAFGGEARPLRGMLTLLAVSAAFGGALYALTLMRGGPPRLSLRVLLTAFFVCYGLLKLLSRFRSRWDGSGKARVRLVFSGREAEFSALIDSGNNARDPATGAGLLVVSPQALRPIFREYTALLEELPPVELVEALSRLPEPAGRLRLVPYRSLGGGGMLPVFRPDALFIDGKETGDLLIAISREARGDGFEAIL